MDEVIQDSYSLKANQISLEIKVVHEIDDADYDLVDEIELDDVQTHSTVNLNYRKEKDKGVQIYVHMDR